MASLPCSSSAFGVQTQVGIKIDPIALVTQECITLISAMRKHARWAQSSVSAILGGGQISSPNIHTSSSPSEAVTETSSTLTVPEETGLARSNSKRGTPVIKPVATKDRIGGIERAAAVQEEDSSLATRFGLRNKKSKPTQDNPLLSALARLRRDLATCRDISTFDAPALLHPFLQVIRSSSTSATITSLAVISITKFLNYNIISTKSPRIEIAMQLLSAAITHCRFEASETAADEVVLLRILKLMEITITCSEGSLLGDESICEIMSTGLSMCCQARLSEVLRRSAEMAMVNMCQIVFGRLDEIEIEPDSTQLPTRSRSNTVRSAAPEEMKIQPSLDGSVMGNGIQNGRASLEETPNLEIQRSEQQQETQKDQEKLRSSGGEEDEQLSPFGLPSIRELFRVLIDLLDPHNRQHNNAMRVMALRIIDVALEVSGPAIAAQPSLAGLVEDDLCRHLFQLVRTDDMPLLNSSLRVAGTLLTTCRVVLKLQQELYLSYLVACLHPNVEIPLEPGIDPALYEGVPQAPKLVKPAPAQQQPGSGRATPVPVRDRRQLGLEGGQRRPEAREAMVEAIGTLIRLPGFMSELFLNYDCHVERQDLCEDMVGLLARNAFSDAAFWSTANVPPLCLDSLLTFVQQMADRSSYQAPAGRDDRMAHLREQRRRKKIIKAGSMKFNDNPKGGIAFLVKNGIIDNPDDPVQIAKFLKSTSHISKTVLGEFITKKTNQALLTEFIGLFNFADKRIDEALRELLTSFRLPGESALIERIVEVFVSKYLSSPNTDSIADDTAGYVLTYAVIMLNTDLYNPQVAKTQKRMASEDFARNLRGTNGNKDFDPEYLQDIYDAIKQNEIILPDEHDNKDAFDHAWRTMLLRTQAAGQLELCEDSAFDADMFKATWKPIVATFNYVFMSATEDAVFSRIITGYQQCAQLSAIYDIPDAFDRIVYSLAQISSLAPDIPPSTSLNTEVQAGKRKVMVSELAVRLGRDFRAQLSATLLFHTLSEHVNSIDQTWTFIVRILRNLFINALVSLPVQETGKITSKSPIPLQIPSQVIDRDGRSAEAGIFSSFTTYLAGYAADDPPEPSEEELENTLSSVDCIKACNLEGLIEQMLELSPTQTLTLVSAILSEIPEESSPLVAVKPDIRPAPVTARVNGSRSGRQGPEYDPGNVFLLELATRLALRDDDTLDSTGELVTNALQAAVRNAEHLHPIAVSHIVTYLFDLLKHSYTYEWMRAPVVLHAISSFTDPVLDATAPAVVSGLTSCILASTPLQNDVTASPDFWSTLQRLHLHKTEADNVFTILSQLVQDSQPTISSTQLTRTTSVPAGITPSSYEPALTLATSIATSIAPLGAHLERQRDLAARKHQKPSLPSQSELATLQRAHKSFELILSMSHLCSTFISQSHLDRSEAWAQYWSPIFRGLCGLVIGPCRELRHRAISTLLRILLSNDVVKPEDLNISKRVDVTSMSTSDDNAAVRPAEESVVVNEWPALFTEVLFPLCLRLLKPEVHRIDPIGMSETRLSMVTVLCKTFLRYFDLLAQIPPRAVVVDVPDTANNNRNSNESVPATPDASERPPSIESVNSAKAKTRTKKEYTLARTWARTLDLLDRLRNATNGTKEVEAIEEAVHEGVKNVLLVLGDSGYLRRPGTAQGQEQVGELGAMERQLWSATGKRVERLVPGLVDEVFPVPAEIPKEPENLEKPVEGGE